MTDMLSRAADGTLSLYGDLSTEDVRDLERQLLNLSPATEGGLRLDLMELDLLDPGGVLRMHELLRQLAKRFPPLVILHAPQVLAHSLYRVGDLKRPDLYLIEPREEEPYG